MGDSTSKPLFYIENVELKKDKRRTIKLYGANNGPLLGYASWELEEHSGRTRVTYHVYAEILLTAQEINGLTTEDLSKAQAGYVADNEVRFRTELQDLKRRIELGSLKTPGAKQNE